MKSEWVSPITCVNEDNEQSQPNFKPIHPSVGCDAGSSGGGLIQEEQMVFEDVAGRIWIPNESPENVQSRSNRLKVKLMKKNKSKQRGFNWAKKFKMSIETFLYCTNVKSDDWQMIESDNQADLFLKLNESLTKKQQIRLDLRRIVLMESKDMWDWCTTRRHWGELQDLWKALGKHEGRFQHSKRENMKQKWMLLPLLGKSWCQTSEQKGRKHHNDVDVFSFWFKCYFCYYKHVYTFIPCMKWEFIDWLIVKVWFICFHPRETGKQNLIKGRFEYLETLELMS